MLHLEQLESRDCPSFVVPPPAPFTPPGGADITQVAPTYWLAEWVDSTGAKEASWSNDGTHWELPAGFVQDAPEGTPGRFLPYTTTNAWGSFAPPSDAVITKVGLHWVATWKQEGLNVSSWSNDEAFWQLPSWDFSSPPASSRPTSPSLPLVNTYQPPPVSALIVDAGSHGLTTLENFSAFYVENGKEMANWYSDAAWESPMLSATVPQVLKDGIVIPTAPGTLRIDPNGDYSLHVLDLSGTRVPELWTDSIKFSFSPSPV